MATVIDRLRELQDATEVMVSEIQDVWARNDEAGKRLHLLLALYSAEKAKDQAAIDKALADLEKEVR